MVDQKLSLDLTNRFAILYPLNNPGCSEVYVAYDFVDHERVAITCFAEKYFHVTNQALQLLPKLRHAHLAKIKGIHVSGSSIIIVQEYIYGRLLEEIIALDEMPKRHTVEKWTEEIESALVYLHRQKPNGFAHGDVKPANIVIDQFKEAKLIDFSSMVELNRLEYFKNLKATRLYAADQVLRTGRYDAACDWFSFQLLCRQLLG